MYLARRHLWGLTALTLAGIALSGCEIQRANQAATAQSAMLGMTKEQILACMGPPANTAVAGGTEVWTYNSGNGRTDSFGVANGWGGRGWATFLGSSSTTARYCKVDVVMNFSRVSRINYTGPTGGLLTKGEQCSFAVENCTGGTNISASMAAPSAPPKAASSPSPAAPEAAESPSDAAAEPMVPLRCTKEDKDMAREAKANGYRYSANCI